MWESPIDVMEIQDSFVSEIKEKTEEMVFTEIKRIGIDVDKEELIKALQYDRNQYGKGYKDGYEKAIDEFARRLKYENRQTMSTMVKYSFEEFVDKIAEQLKGVRNE